MVVLPAPLGPSRASVTPLDLEVDTGQDPHRAVGLLEAAGLDHELTAHLRSFCVRCTLYCVEYILYCVWYTRK